MLEEFAHGVKRWVAGDGRGCILAGSWSGGGCIGGSRLFASDGGHGIGLALAAESLDGRTFGQVGVAILCFIVAVASGARAKFAR